MIAKLKNILEEYSAITAWKIVSSRIESSEYFFIKQKLDMNRAKDVEHISLTIYKDFIEDEIKYRGSSTVTIYPTMTDAEIKTALEQALVGASFIKNKYYPLVEQNRQQLIAIDSDFAEKPLVEWLPLIATAIFKADRYQNGSLNSAEIFLDKIETRIVNSTGLDVKFNKYKGLLELVTNWQEQGEEVELAKEINFAAYNPEQLTAEVDKLLTMCQQRTMTSPTPAMKNCTVLLTGDPVKEFLNYYYRQTNAQLVYEQVSTAKLASSIQGEQITGDKLTVRLDPLLAGSTAAAPYDQDGFPLQEVAVIEEGIVKKFWGNKRYSSYLEIATTGDIGNFIVEPGQQFVDEFKTEPYLELLAFSDFQMDVITGDFAGEIRLGHYFNGGQTIPVSGGSISGNIKDVQQELYLSREIQTVNNFQGPQTIKLSGVKVAGH